MNDILNVLVGQPSLLRYQTLSLIEKISNEGLGLSFDFIAANANRGMVYGWGLREDFESQQIKNMPLVYIRQTQKVAGHKELITGNRNNPLIKKGDRALIVEAEEDPEIFVKRALQASQALRDAGYQVDYVATLYPPNQDTENHLHSSNLRVVYSTSREQIRDDIATESKKLLLPIYGDRSVNITEIGKAILDAGALEIRDVENGEEPFLYSSGNKGPGFLMIKGLTGQPQTLKYLCQQLAFHLADKKFDFVAANVTGGLIPGFELRNQLERIRGKEVPFVYVEGTRRIDTDMKDLGVTVVGNKNNPLILDGDGALVHEELVNFAQTTTNSALALREIGYVADNAATIFYYDHKPARELLSEKRVDLAYLITLPQFLDVAEQSGKFEKRLVDDYRSYLENPRKWQLDRGITPPEQQKED